MWLENVSHVVGQNSLIPESEQNSLTPKGNNKWVFLPRVFDWRVIRSSRAPWNRGKFVSRRPNDFFSAFFSFFSNT